MLPDEPILFNDARRGKSLDTTVALPIGISVFLIHCVLQFVLYRSNSQHSLHSNFAQLAFVVLNGGVLLTYGVLAFYWLRGKSWTVVESIAVAVAMMALIGFFSLLCSLLVPVNVYGS